MNNELYYCLFGDIDTETIIPIIKLCNGDKKANTLHLYINSNGGSVTSAFALANFLTSLKNVSVITYNIGTCDSAACIIFLAGNIRICVPQATFYIHSSIVHIHTKQNISTLSNALKNLINDTNLIINYFTSKTKLSKQCWKNKLSESGCFISDRQSLAYGISTKIENFQIKPTNNSINFTE